MTFKIGQTVQRREGNRNTAPMVLKSQFDVDHVTDLQARGYEYAVVTEVDDLDFELPTVQGTGLRIHRKPFEECESCSA